MMACHTYSGLQRYVQLLNKDVTSFHGFEVLIKMLGSSIHQ